MRLLIFLLVIVVLLVVDVSAKKKKWLKQPIVLKKDNGKTETGEYSQKRKESHHGSRKHQDGHLKVRRKQLNFKKGDALPYSSPYARPYDWNMYTDGPYGWGPSRRRRDTNSFEFFKRSLYPRNYVPQYYNQPQVTANQQAAYFNRPAQQAVYPPPAPQPYNYQAAASRNTLALANPRYWRPPLAQPLRKQPPMVQRPRERTWVDKMGVKWTTRKVNDYKWGEREPGIMMDEYAGGPFGFNDVKRSEIIQAKQRQWHRRASIPRPHPRSWIDRNGVRWTNDHVNDYKWGEREPGVTMDEYNGGPYGWNDVKRNRISVPSTMSSPRNMFMDRP